MSTAADYIKQAEDWAKNERPKKAIEAYEQAIAYLVKQPTTSQTQLQMATCFQELGHLWRLLGNNKHTGSNYKKSLDLYVAAHRDAPHEDTATATFLIGSFLSQIWKVVPAIDYLKKAHAMMATLHGADHTYTTGIAAHLEQAIKKQSEFK